MRPKYITRILLAFIAIICISEDLHAQRFKKKKPEILFARNKRKNVSPVYVGIGTKEPTAQFHTTGSVRFEGITVNNNLNTVLALDGSGNLFWRDMSGSLANAWVLTGNSTNGTSFLGTTNNDNLRIRTNNIQRAVITNAGDVGIGVAVPTAQLHTNGSVRLEGLTNDDTKDRILVADNAGNLFWRTASSIAAPLPAWLLNGNAAPANSFLGTTNAEDLRFRVNNVQRAVLTASGQFGIGVAAPTAQLHTNGTIRFENIAANNATTKLATLDNTGNLYYRDISSLQSNFWSLTGNTGTNPAQNFIGTSDNTRLVFRSNNLERMTITASGNLGAGTSTPLAKLHVATSAGTMTGFPYEPMVVEGNADTKLTVVSTDNTAVGGAAVVLGHSNYTVAGFFPAFEMQYGVNNGRYLRFNYLNRNANGVIQSSVPNIMILSDNSRVGINLGPSDGALTPVYPTANFHTNGTVRLQGLANGSGNPLVVDNNGNVFVGTAGSGTAWNLTGNAGTNPATNFLGTTDNVRMGIRANNVERITVLPNGNVGINNTSPAAQFVITNNTTPDFHLRIQGLAPSITLEGSPGPNNEGRIGYVTVNNNFVNGSIPGDLVVQTLGANNNLIFGTTGGGSGNGIERGRFNPVGYFGIATNNPTAKLHVNCVPVSGQTNPSNIRFENLPSGTGNALAIDANGYVFRSSTVVNRNEAEALKKEIDDLRAEVSELRQIVQNMQVSIQGNMGDQPLLFQNNPNPYDKTTTIRYFLPDDKPGSSLVIVDLQGRVIKNLSISGKGLHTLNIGSGELSPGTYFYSLYSGNKKIDSKKMIMTR